MGYYMGPRREDASLWAPLWETETYTLAGAPANGSLTPAEQVVFRAAMFDTLQAAGVYAPMPTALRTADLTIRRFSWLGLASNAWAILCASGLVMWYRPVNRIRRQREAAAAEWRRCHGECPHCGYSRSGLLAARCPECGNELGEPMVPRG